MEFDESGRPNISEKGVGSDGKPVYSDRRLLVQFLAYGHCRDTGPLVRALEEAQIRGVLYQDMNDPLGVGLAVASEDSNFFVDRLRDMLRGPAFDSLTAKPEYTMLGRTYAIGYEADLDHVLVHRPLQRLTDPASPWVVWYPLRRHGAFEKLSGKEQRDVLAEHGRIGNAFGQENYAHDIRLACHGLDKNDNDFVVGLVGPELYPLSAIVQTMRKTKQTSTYLESLGPFFIGKACWQSPPPSV